MRALVYTQPGEVQLQERPEPELLDGEVVLRIDAVGICGSDLHAYHGHDPRRLPGLVLGHELSGTVESSAVAHICAGMRFTANPLITCGRCRYCIQGRDNLCSDRTMVGMTRPGAFADYMSIPARCLVPIPSDMSAVHAALTEPAATALHALNLCMRALIRPVGEARVLVIGGGAIGMLSALLLRSYGGRRLTMVERNPLRRESAERHVQCEVVDTLDASRSAQYDLVIDAVGAKGTRDLAFQMIAAGGVVMHIGLQDWASEIDMRKLTLSEITLLGTYTYTMADLHATVAALHDGVFGNLGWVESRSLDHGDQAFRDLDEGRTAASKLVLVP